MAAAPGTCRIRSSGHLVPDPIEAPNDKSDAYPQVSGKKDCFAYVPSFPLTTCHFGRRHAAVRVALVGNSHAGQWVSTMESLANAEMWSVTTYLASRCAFADLKQQFDTPAHSAACQSWTRRAERTIAAKHYDLVIMTNRVSVPAEGKGTIRASQAAYGRGYEAVLARLRAAGEPVLALHDTPAPLRSIPDCLAAHPHDYPACNGKARSWIRGEPLTAAVRRLHDPGITYVDLNRYLCRNGTCPAVIGGVVAYFDGSHMTATFARTLAPYLRDYALRAMTAR
jgi:hypothetical protein